MVVDLVTDLGLDEEPDPASPVDPLRVEEIRTYLAAFFLRSV